MRVPDDAKPIDTWTDGDIAARYDDPARTALETLQAGRRDGATRFVFVLPERVSAASEAVRLLMLGAARQWESDGITVNCIVGDNAAAMEFLASGAVTGKTL